MKLVICHHHLNRGGVSRVIENHLRAIAELDQAQQPSSVLVVHGGRTVDWNFSLGDELPFDLQYESLPSLEYDAENLSRSTSHELARDLANLLISVQCTISNTIVHIHNHSLGKSASLPGAIHCLAKQGWRMLLQIHDFAEDLRPENYVHMLDAVGGVENLHAQLYPQASHLHYATLNHRDHELFALAGVAASQLHKLPNPVVAISRASDDEWQEIRCIARQKLASRHGIGTDVPYILYPVRGIQRKNLGELLLWASLSPEATFAITLSPINSRERKSYDGWKSLAQDLSLSVLFEAGETLSFSENYAASDAIITTSVAEGFGLVYLEAALMDRPLLGRNLEGITEDFRRAGMQFPGLTNRIRVPTSLADRESIRQNLIGHAVRLRNAYRLPHADVEQLDEDVTSLIRAEMIDFARLDTETQKKIIRQVNADSALRLCLREQNPKIDTMATLACEDDQIVRANQRVIHEHYSLRTVGRQLRAIYTAIENSAPGGIVESSGIARSLQRAFLRADQLFPLRLEQ